MQGYKTFLINTFGKESNPIGDFARDAKAAKDFPDRVDNKKEVRFYLECQGASDVALSAFENSWLSYVAYKKAMRHYEPKENTYGG